MKYICEISSKMSTSIQLREPLYFPRRTRGTVVHLFFLLASSTYDRTRAVNHTEIDMYISQCKVEKKKYKGGHVGGQFLRNNLSRVKI